jgi:hypothetical protein
MKKTLLAFAGLFVLASGAQASISIEIDAGILYSGTSTATRMPIGGLLQLVATRGGGAGVFVPPMPGAFVSGDNLVVSNFAMNYVIQPGETDNVVIFNLENTTAATPATFDVGDALLLRWYPTLNTSSTAANLVAGTPYGQYRSVVGESGGVAWVTPADGTVLTLPNGLNFNTIAASGTNPEAVGFASLIVVPEPSTIGMVLVGGLFFLGMGHRFSRAKS